MPYSFVYNLHIICRMKQKFWRELKSRLCPRQNWVMDADSSRCQCCGKQFTFLRRRHHCRFCGKLFCSHCSDLYINGTYLGLSEKYVRHCEFCKEEIEKIKKDLNRLTYMVQEEEDFAKSEEDDESNSSSDQDREFFSIKAIFGDCEEETQLKFAEELDFEIKNMSRKMFGRLVELGNISPEYLGGRLLEHLLRAVVQSRMNILPYDLNSKSSYMDITKQVSIKVLNGHPGEYVEIVQGMILEKSLPVKHMLNRLIKPQIIIIENSLDESGVKVKFEDLISNDHIISEQLEERIMKFNPDIVFVERSINRQILNFFSERGITVISGIKKKDIARIVQISGVRSTIKNVWAIEKYKPYHLIGTLDLMHTKKFDKNTEPIIYFQKNVGVYSIMVSERTHDAQNTLKRSLQVLMKFMRIINLQKYLIYVDFEMWSQKQAKNVPRLTQINPNHLSEIQRMKCEQIEFYRLRYSQKEVDREDKKLRQYLRSKSRSNYLQNCGQDHHEIITPYSQYDNTIGHFLLIMATNFITKCSECKLHHRERYYFTDCGIEVSINSLKENRHEEEIHDETDLNIDRMKKYLKKYKENWNIFTYFQCKYCQSIVSKRVKIGKNYLKNSFYYFLYLVANCQEEPLPYLSSLQTIKSQDRVFSSNMSNSSSRNTIGRQNSRKKNVPKECGHSMVERVLQTSDILFRMQVFTINHYEISSIDLKDDNYLSIYRENLKQYIIQLTNTEIQQKFSFQATLKDIVNNYIGVLEPFRFQEPVDYKIIIQLQKLETVRQILGKLQAHLQDFWAKEKGKEYSYNSDWTYFVREMAKIDDIMKIAIDILRVVQGNLYKRKKKIEEVENVSVYTNEECEPFLPNADNEIKEEVNSRISRQYSDDTEQIPQITSYRLSRQKSQEDRQSSKSGGTFARKVYNNNSIFSFSLVYDETKLRKFYEETKRRRYQLKKGQYIYFNLVNYKKTLSVLVCALNSSDFKEQIQRKNVDVFKFNLILSKSIPTSWDLKLKIDKLKGESGEDQIQPRESFEIIVYSHRQFQHFREMEGISHENYIKSLANSKFWETVGGKSNSQFAKSSDQLLVIKTIKHEQFGQFLKFASDYLRHIKTENQNSYLAKIFGIYEVIIKGDSYKLVVMQNLFLAFEGLPYQKYDLKGSKVNRLFTPKSNENITGLDTNFRIDKNYHPYFISHESYTKFFHALEQDIAFLCKNQVIDYSLLVIEHENKLRMGIIDFMRPYHLMQKIENKYKELTNKNKMLPTVLPPRQYADRFLSAMKQYFAFYT